MADVRFTPEQQSAIMADNPELLISAAAGSGKTAVLVERILRLIRDHHIDMNRMLVVTYTRAAAAELRGDGQGVLLEGEGVNGLVLGEIRPDAQEVFSLDGFYVFGNPAA